MESIWEGSATHVCFNPLKESKSTDVLIVGGGITGILCAYMLKNKGIDCILVEADKICKGITMDTTAKITLGHGLLYHKLIKSFGQENARLYLQAQLQAFEKYANMCKEISCDYETKDSYVYSRNNRKKVECEVKALQLLGIKADFFDEISLPFKIAGAVCERRSIASGLPVNKITATFLFTFKISSNNLYCTSGISIFVFELPSPLTN